MSTSGEASSLPPFTRGGEGSDAGNAGVPAPSTSGTLGNGGPQTAPALRPVDDSDRPPDEGEVTRAGAIMLGGILVVALVLTIVGMVFVQTVVRQRAADAAAGAADAPHKLGDADAKAALAPAAATDWPGYFGPRGDGRSSETGLLKSWPAKGPAVLWKLDTGDAYGCPSVARGRLVHHHRLGDAELVDCLDPATGKRFWRHRIPADYRDQYGAGEGPRTTPLIHGDHVCTLGPAGGLTAVALSDGKPVWTRNVKTDFEVPDNFFGVGAGLIVEQGVLVLNVGGKGAGVVGFDPATGKTLWQATDDGAGYSTPVAAKFADKPAVVVFTRNGVVVIDPKTGTVLHSVRHRARIAASVNAASPVVSGDLVWVTASYGTGELLLRHAAGKFAEVRRGEALSAQFATPVLLDGLLYGFDGRYDGDSNLTCVELESGKVLWTEPTIAAGTLIHADGRFVIRSEGRILLAELDAKGCKVVSTVEGVVGSPGYAPPVLSGGLLFVRDRRTLACLDVRAGK